jgi:gluconolactonase
MEIRTLSPRLRRLLDPETRLERLATGFRFTEGPLWDPRAGALLFSDIPADRIYRWSEAGGAAVFREPSGKSNGLTWDLQGRLLACEHLNRRVSRTLDDGSVVPVAARYAGRRLNSPNDLVVRSDGALYFTDPPYGIQSPEVGEIAEQEQPLNGLYLLRPGETEPLLLADDFDRPNGLAFSPDERTLYVADTPRYHVRAFAVREDGALEGGAVLAELPADAGEGRPDGLKVDVEGNIYTTGPGGLWIVAPGACPPYGGGELLGHLRFPEKTANCAWGDADLRSLFVTASTSLYRLRVLVPGVPALRSP